MRRPSRSAPAHSSHPAATSMNVGIHVRHHPPAPCEPVGRVLVGRSRPLVDAVEGDELREGEPHRSPSPASATAASCAVTVPQPSAKPSCSCWARAGIGVADDGAVRGALGMVAEGDLRRHPDRRGLGRPPTAVERIGEHDALAGLDDHEAGVEVRAELVAVLAHQRDEPAAGHDLEPLDATVHRGRQPPAGQVERVGPGLPHPSSWGTDDAVDLQIEVRVEIEAHDGSLASVTNDSRRSVRPSHTARCSASHPSMTARRLRLRVHVRTRPDFLVRISPQRSRVWTCFMNDGIVIDADRASSLTLAGDRPKRRTTRRRVGSASAVNTSSRVAEYCAMRLSIVDGMDDRKYGGTASAETAASGVAPEARQRCPTRHDPTRRRHGKVTVGPLLPPVTGRRIDPAAIQRPIGPTGNL